MLDRPAEPKRVSDSVLHKLATLTVETKRGNIEAIAVVSVGPDGEPRAHFAGEGDLVASINLGVDMLKATIMDRIRQTQMNSGLILPGAN
jgi:hypothetical protein